MDNLIWFEQILDEFLDRLLLYAGLWNRAEAEDVVQETFMKLLQKQELPENPRCWLFRVVRNEMIDRLRHDQMRHRKLNEICQSRINQNNWFEPSPDESDFTAEELQTALEQLSKEQQEIVVAKIWGELTFEEIADLTNSSRSRIHRIYQNTLIQLREILQNKLQ